MAFDSMDYHPGLNDPWLLVALALVAILAAGVTFVAKRSRPWVIATGLMVVVASPFVVRAVLHGLYSLVDPEVERMLCTHYVRHSTLPESSALVGVALGLVGRSRYVRPQVSHGQPNQNPLVEKDDAQHAHAADSW
jgi:hypothetical protein